MKLLIVNGPNLNLIGQREQEIYGETSFDSFLQQLRNENAGVSIDYFQSNIEGELIDQLQASDHDGIILNAGGYTHTSVAIHDCVAAIKVPVVEVHISNIAKRESYRHESLISSVAVGCLFGFSLDGYSLAVDYFKNYLNRR